MSKQTVTCDYCQQPAELVNGAVIYPHRPDLKRLKFWLCRPCGAYVGCHDKRSGNGDGTKPKGRLADAALRRAKRQAHDAFDPLWMDGDMSRKTAYGWLAKRLGLARRDCHIGMFDIEQCQQVIAVCQERAR